MPWQRLLHVKKNKFGRYGLVILFIIKLWTMWSTCKLKNFDISLNGKKQNDICRVNKLELNISDKQLYQVIAKLVFSICIMPRYQINYSWKKPSFNEFMYIRTWIYTLLVQRSTPDVKLIIL